MVQQVWQLKPKDIIRIDGRYISTQDGTFAARFANELAANTDIVVQKGSYGWWY
jgi:hypothetical protein